MSWFEDWFDSPLYEKLYANRNEDEASLLADLIKDEIPINQYPDILDLGCGRGRHSITLAERGYEVTGVDLSEEAIKKAQSKAKEKNLDNVLFKIGDMRNPLPGQFSAVVNLFTTFGYFLDDSENIQVLKSISTMLRKNGLLLIDFLNATYVKNNLVPQESGNYGEYTYQIERVIQQHMVFKAIRFSGGSLTEPVEYIERVKLYDHDWFEANLKRHGFLIKKVYGDYKGNPFDPEISSRLLMVAQKL
jgi:SAM-dependent methyltransferase